MADNNIDLTASFDTSQAIKSVNKFGDEATKSISGVNKSVDSLQSNIKETSGKKFIIDTSAATSAIDGLKGKFAAFGAGIAAYFSVQAIGSFFNTMVSEAVDAQNNLNQLNAALARTGQLTPEVSASMAKFATDLMSVSTIDDDVINGQLAIALNFTKSADKAQELVGAAANLSAAMKIDLGTAVELLGKTLDGTAGRLNETVPALRGVSEEALKSGAAIQIVNQQFAGAATAEISTYSGAMTQLSNVFGNFAASLGNMVVQNPMVAQSIKEISTALIGATANIEAGTSASISFVNRGLIALISGIRDLLPSLNAVMSFMKSIAFLFETMLKGVMSFVDGLKILGNSWLWLIGTMSGKKQALSDIDAAMERMRKRGDELSESLMNIGKDSFSKLDLKSFDEAMQRIQDAANKKPIEIPVTPKVNTKAIDTINWDDYIKNKIEDVNVKPNIDLNNQPEEVKFSEDQLASMGFEEWFNNLSDYLDQFIVDFTKPYKTPITIDWNEYVGLPKENPFVQFYNDALDGVKAAASYVWNVVPGIQGVTYMISRGFFEVTQYLKKNIPNIIKNITGLITAMGEGAEGAKKAIPDMLAKMTEGIGSAVGTIWGPFGTAVGGALGNMVGEQIKLASQPIGDTIKAIDEFMAELPNVLDRIVDNLPTIMNKVFENLPKILVGILKALPAILRASASAMKPLFKELFKELPSIAQALMEIAWEMIAGIFMAIGYAVQGAAIGLQEMLKEKFNAAGERITEVFTNLFDGTFADSVRDTVKGAFGGLFDGTFLQNIRDTVSGAFGGLFDGTFLQNIRDTVKGAFGGLFDGTFEKNIKDTFIDGFGGLFDGTFEKNIKDIFTDAFGGLFDGTFEKNIKDIFMGAFGGLFDGSFFKDVGETIQKGFEKLFSALNPAEWIQGGGKGGKTGGEVLVNVLSGGFLAKGGVVPPGYPDDKYPAMLTSNEVVVPASTTPNLFALIDKLANGQTPNNQSSDETNQLLRQLIVVMMNQQTQIDVKLDRDTLAKAILSLNKDNRRLA